MKKDCWIWVVYFDGEPEFASDKYHEAMSRCNFLADNYGQDRVEIKAVERKW